MALAEIPNVELDDQAQRHLARLMRSWALLADIAFADLLLCVPEHRGAETAYTVVGHVRPTTSPSIYRTEMVGRRFEAGDRPLLDLARTQSAIVDGGLILRSPVPRIRTLVVPVVHRGAVIAVLSRDFSPDEQRTPGELEINYFFAFRRLAGMIAEGGYPFRVDDAEVEEAPRVSDGVILLDASARVRFASPNAVSVLSRLGVPHVEGQRLAVAGMRQRAIAAAFQSRHPEIEEIELADQNVVVRCLPIIEGGELTGAIVLLRDITELRRRDRLLLSKDATIAEIHHRVKNNLQTISSLLRLQGRRVVADEARQAIDESVRRIRSIAVVHEILSKEVANDVPFEDIVRPLVRLVEEGLVSRDEPVQFEIEGRAGQLPAAVATPIAVVLTELMQNAVEHGLAGPGRAPAVRMRFGDVGNVLEVELIDEGVGVPADFDIAAQSGLGLTIVRSLVENDLAGSITIERATPEGGTRAAIVVPGLDAWRTDDLAADIGRR